MSLCKVEILEKEQSVKIIPEDFDFGMFKELRMFSEFNNQDYFFIGDIKKQSKINEIASFYNQPSGNFTKGQRNFIRKIQSEQHEDLVFYKRGSMLVVIDPNSLTGTIDQLKSIIAGYDVEVVKTVNRTRIYFKYSNNVPASLAAHIKTKTGGRKKTSKKIQGGISFDTITTLSHFILRNVQNAEKGTEEAERIVLYCGSPDNQLDISAGANYMKVAYWIKGKYQNKVQITYKKQYKESEIINRLNKLIL